MKFSSNPYEFIRQCHSQAITSHDEIYLQAWEHAKTFGSAEFAGRVTYLLSKTNHVDFLILQGHRQMVRDLATEMLGKVLYTQEQFAGKLIALMTEFGVGVAVIDEHTAIFDDNIFWTVTIYTPEAWGKSYEFQSKEVTEAFAAQINSYGDFTL